MRERYGITNLNDLYDRRRMFFCNVYPKSCDQVFVKAFDLLLCESSECVYICSVLLNSDASSPTRSSSSSE